MKTFETEKHNIPEGATHYINDSSEFDFGWFKVDGEKVYKFIIDCWVEFVVLTLDFNPKPIPQSKIETPEEKEVLDLIDTTPHQYEMSKFSGNEWSGEGLPPVGAICNWRMASGEVEICGRYGNMTWIFDIEMGTHVSVKDADGFTKIETPQQREERERLEAAYDLYVDFSGKDGICTFEEFVIKLHLVSKWLRIVDKTNYRKESE